MNHRGTNTLISRQRLGRLPVDGVGGLAQGIQYQRSVRPPAVGWVCAEAAGCRVRGVCGKCPDRFQPEHAAPFHAGVSSDRFQGIRFSARAITHRSKNTTMKGPDEK